MLKRFQRRAQVGNLAARLACRLVRILGGALGQPGFALFEFVLKLFLLALELLQGLARILDRFLAGLGEVFVEGACQGLQQMQR